MQALADYLKMTDLVDRFTNIYRLSISLITIMLFLINLVVVAELSFSDISSEQSSSRVGGMSFLN